MKPWALVTGASSGIGAELARIYAEQDHNVIVVARREDKLTELATELRGKGAEVQIVAMDLALKKSPRQLFKTVQDLGLQVDVLVNNAGFTHHGPFVEMAPSEVVDMTQLNMSTVAALCRHFAGPMVEAGDGRILNVSSITAFQPVPGFALYAASKAFLLSFTEALSEELKRHRRQRYCAVPGTHRYRDGGRCAGRGCLSCNPFVSDQRCQECGEGGLRCGQSPRGGSHTGTCQSDVRPLGTEPASLAGAYARWPVRTPVHEIGAFVSRDPDTRVR